MLDLSRISDAVRSEGGITRRLLLAYGTALAAIPTLGLRAACQPKGSIKFQDYPFSLGVASGDPADDAVVIWTRLAPLHKQPGGGMPRVNVPVDWEIADDEMMKNVIQKDTVVATPELGHSVHVEVEKLKPNRWYWYQFECGGVKSPIGRTRTMPKATASPKELRFAFASCQNYEDGHFNAYHHMAREELDLVVFLGDYIYEFAPRKNKVREHIGEKGEECKSLEAYRLRYCQYRHDEQLRKMHARCPWVVTWDDHEVEGNYADAHSKHNSVKPAAFLEHRAHAYQAYYEMMPLRKVSLLPKKHDMKLYRTVSFGELASFQVLDTRQYRSDQLNNAEPIDIPAKLDDKLTMLGAKQKKWLEDELRQSKATWNVLAQQVMMAMVDRDLGKGKKYSTDAWPGYAHERIELMSFLKQHVKNPIVLSGDIHSNWVNNLSVDDRKPDKTPAATEFVCTSISSKGNGEPVREEHLTKLKQANPCVQFHNDQRGYVRCIVTPETWQSDFVTVADVTKELKADDKTPAETEVSYIVRAGKAGAVKK